MSLLDRRPSDGDIGVCTPIQNQYGRGRWLSSPARLTCMTINAEQLQPPRGDGPVATADERRNIARLDRVMSVLQTSLLVKKLPARKNELLHAFFRDESRTNRHVARAIQ